MKKLKMIVANLFLVAALAMALPTLTFASDGGPQGGSKSTTPAPQPPPPDTLFWIIIHALCG
jgi:hypothetical protein